jgi:hypothetical protein
MSLMGAKGGAALQSFPKSCMKWHATLHKNDFTGKVKISW